MFGGDFQTWGIKFISLLCKFHSYCNINSLFPNVELMRYCIDPVRYILKVSNDSQKKVTYARNVVKQKWFRVVSYIVIHRSVTEVLVTSVELFVKWMYVVWARVRSWRVTGFTQPQLQQRKHKQTVDSWRSRVV